MLELLSYVLTGALTASSLVICARYIKDLFNEVENIDIQVR